MLMKKSIVLFLSLCMAALNGVRAGSVSQSDAQVIAANFFKLNVPVAGSVAVNASLCYTKSESSGVADYYVFNMSPVNGFVIVSADNRATPILGYSSESLFNPNIPSVMGLGDWMNSAAVRISHIVDNNIQPDARIQGLWSAYAAGINPSAARATTVGPLLQTTWNQNPYYNSLCPPAGTASTSSSKSVTGCVATAMAQIMKYWNYPTRGTGSNSYNDAPPAFSQNYGTLTADFTRYLDWAVMSSSANVPNVYSNTSPVDSLMYELGVAVDMDYSPTGSGAYVLNSEAPYGGWPTSQSVFQNNFYYDPSTLQGVYLSSYSDAGWIGVMEGEINAGRVVQYEGNDPTQGGHTWVMDGYQTSPSAAGGALVHMNWGWGGTYNGWFDVTNLSTGSGAGAYNPSQNDAALIGIQPLRQFSLTIGPSNPSMCSGGSGINLTVQGPASANYTWTPSTGLSCTNCQNPTAFPTSSTLYTVSADSAGVIVTTSVEVSVNTPVTGNFSAAVANTCGLPQSVTFNNNTNNANIYAWDFGDGSPASTVMNPIHTYTAVGTYTATLMASNGCGTDTLVSMPIQITGGAPVAAPQTVCAGQAATLSATGSGVNWYSDAAGTNLVQAGSSFTTAPVAGTTTFYVGSSVTPSAATAGPVSDAFGATSQFTGNNVTRGMYFISNVDQQIVSVVVYANGAGNRTFVLIDSASNTVLDSFTTNLINGQQTVPLGFNVTGGSTELIAITGQNFNMERNTSGAIFPYVASDGSLSITNNNAAAPGRYYFFYNWHLQQNSCTTPLVPVTVYVLSSGSGAFTATGNGSPAVNFTPQNTSATTYEWNFGDGTSSSQMNASHTYATGGVYTVQLIESNGSCSDTITQTINTKSLSVNQLTVLSGIVVSPNPVSDKVNVSLNSNTDLGSCSLKITNLLGQSLYNTEVPVVDGRNSFSIETSGLAPGLYFVAIQNGKNTISTKFVKE